MKLPKQVAIVSKLILCFGFVALMSFTLIDDKKIFDTKAIKSSTFMVKLKAEREKEITAMCKAKGVKFPIKNLFIRIFKADKSLEIWALDNTSTSYKLVKSYPLQNFDAGAGPKFNADDEQIPEGVYAINAFDTAFNDFPAVKLNWPNKADKLNGDNDTMKQDIFIYGGNENMGKIPLGGESDISRDIFYITFKAYELSKGIIPVHIFPFKMGKKEMKLAKETYASNITSIQFWDNLQPVYQKFESNKRLPIITIDKRGRYLVK